MSSGAHVSDNASFRAGSTVGPVVPTYRQALNTAPSPHTSNIFCALGPRSARRMCNEGLDDSGCANNWESARQSLKVDHCSPIGATTSAVIAVQCSAVQPIAGRCLQFNLHCALKLYFLCARQGMKAKCCSPIGASDKACADSQKGSDRRIARADEEYHPRGRRR